MQYQVYRVRRELCNVLNDQAGAAIWAERIGQMELDDRVSRADAVLEAYDFGDNVSVVNRGPWDISDRNELKKTLFGVRDSDAVTDQSHNILSVSA